MNRKSKMKSNDDFLDRFDDNVLAAVILPFETPSQLIEISATSYLCKKAFRLRFKYEIQKS